MAGSITPGNLERIISQAIQQATEELIAEEEKLAIERVRKRIHEAKASIIMAVMTNFDVERDQRQIVIRVRDTTQDGPKS